MIRTACIRLAVVALLLALGAPLAFAGKSSGKCCIGGHVADGLYFESKMNFLEAIREYNQALNEDVQDRFAWVCLAKAYRASDLYSNVVARLYEQYDRQELEARRNRAAKPIIRCSGHYWETERDCAKFGHYSIRIERSQNEYFNEYIEERFGSDVWTIWNAVIAQKRIETTISSCAILRTAQTILCQKKSELVSVARDKAWERVEESSDSAQSWLDLALVSNYEIAAAAYHVVLLSDPSPQQSERAKQGIDRPTQRDDDYDKYIAPDFPPGF